MQRGKVTDAFIDALVRYFQSDVALSDFFNKVASALASILETEANTAATLIGAEPLDTGELVAQWLRTTENQIRSINFYTAVRIREVLIESQARGETVIQAAQHIRLMFGEFDKQRALMIARTEIQAASNFASWTTYGRVGVPFKRWLTVMDGRERETHGTAHMQIQGIFDPFIIGGSLMMYPGDPLASAREVVNCRCTIVPEWHPQRTAWAKSVAEQVWHAFIHRTDAQILFFVDPVRDGFHVQLARTLIIASSY